MALIEFQNLPNTSTPLNAENLNTNFEKNIITVYASDMNITDTTDSQNNTIIFNGTVSSLGNKLSLNTTTGEVTIGSGISYVKVSCGCEIILGSSGMTYHAVSIRKNGSQVGKWAQTKGNYNPNVYGYATLSNVLIPVSEGDKITAAVFNRLAGSYIIGSPYMTVEVVQ